MKKADPPRHMASACLIGVNCRYNGTSRPHPDLVGKFRQGLLIPFCPETLAGMGIPRPRIELAAGRAVDETGTDVTDRLTQASEKITALARTVGPEVIYLKSKSPSCGVERNGITGITAAMLQRDGFNLEERD